MNEILQIISVGSVVIFVAYHNSKQVCAHSELVVKLFHSQKMQSLLLYVSPAVKMSVHQL